MGRAPTGAVPQRVSAHVMAKGPSFVSEDEDEKTMIEAGWEEEASTTVEQGDVAEKIRSLGIGLELPKRATSSITSTSTNNATSEEQTVDDQRASAAIALLPPPVMARLVITLGNDTGQSLEVRAGKTYTIGRGIDNDLVLTDLAVSRKHFDLRHDNGAWVLADRGSGNGTLVNARVEDAPFMLTSGDMIEIGNTAFRFELPVSPATPKPGFDAGGEDDVELATLPASPRRSADVTVPPRSAIAGPRPGPVMPAPPQSPTVALPRPRAPTSRPLASYVLDRPGAQPVPVALSGLAASHGPSVAQQTTAPVLQAASRPPPGALETFNPPQPTLPGHTPAVQPGQPGRPPFAYANRSSVSPQATPVATRAPLVAAQPGQPGHDHTATALVQPISYTNQLPGPASQLPRSMPPLSRRAKLTLGAAGIVLFVVILAIALVRSSGGQPVAAPRELPPSTTSQSAPVVEPSPPAATKPDDESDLRPAASREPRTDRTLATAAPDRPAAASGSAAVAVAMPPAAVAATDPVPLRDSGKVATPLATRSAEPAAAAKPDPRRAPKRPEVKKAERKAVRADGDRDEIKPDTTDRKRAGRALQDLKSEANVLYRAKSFGGAAAQITGSLSLFSGDDLKDLKNVASTYAQLGKAYNIGMAPGTKPTEAYTALVRAKTLDRDVGMAYTAEIDQRLATVASRAAMSFMAAKDYESAAQAVRTSDSLGNTSASNKSVRDNLDALAADLVRTASKELATDPESAKKKLRQVLAIVDSKNPSSVRAAKLLNGP